jgi:hypothetical protein
MVAITIINLNINLLEKCLEATGLLTSISGYVDRVCGFAVGSEIQNGHKNEKVFIIVVGKIILILRNYTGTTKTMH